MRSATAYSLKHVTLIVLFFFFSSRRRHTRFDCDWSSDVCSSDLPTPLIRPVSPRSPASRSSTPPEGLRDVYESHKVDADARWLELLRGRCADPGALRGGPRPCGNHRAQGCARV